MFNKVTFSSELGSTLSGFLAGKQTFTLIPTGIDKSVVVDVVVITNALDNS